MSQTTITKKFYIDGSLKNPTSMVLSEPNEVYGVKRDDNGVVVADGTAMNNISTGQYSYTFTDPTDDLSYSYYVEIVYSGETFYFEGTIDGGTDVTAPYYSTAKMVDLVEIYVNKYGNEEKEVLTLARPLLTALLNRAQLDCVGLLDRRNLDILDTVDTSKALTSSGDFAFSGLAGTVYNGAESIDDVKISGSTGKYCTVKDFDEYKDMVNADHTFVVAAPICYFRAEKVHVEPNSGTSTSIDIYYMKTPTTHVDGSGTPTAFSQPVLEIIIEYTAHLAFKYINNPRMGDVALRNVMQSINIMNDKQIIIGEKEAGLD